MQSYKRYWRPTGLNRMILMLAVFGIAACAVGRIGLLPENGFRDLAWGTPLSEASDLTLLKRGGGRWQWAVRDPERLEIGDVAVDGITYIFVDQSFAGVNVRFSGFETYRRLMERIKEDWGKPTVTNKPMNMIAWKRAGTTVLLRFYRRPNTGELKYTHDASVAD